MQHRQYAVKGTRWFEAAVGAYTGLLCLWVFLFDAFTTVFYRLWEYSGHEWIVAVVGVPYGVAQGIAAFTSTPSTRSWLALGSIFFMTLILVSVWQNQGHEVLGIPALALTIGLQSAVFLRLRIA